MIANIRKDAITASELEEARKQANDSRDLAQRQAAQAHASANLSQADQQNQAADWIDQNNAQTAAQYAAMLKLENKA